MKNAWLYLGTLAGSAGFVILTILLIVQLANAGLIQHSGNLAVPAATICVPTPQPPTEVPGTRTPTPNPSQYGTVQPVQPTMTPFPIKRTVDLSPELPEHDKIHWLVFHCDGTYEMFLTASSTQQTPLQPGDVLIYADLPALMDHQVIPAPTLGTPATPVPPPTLQPEVFTEAAPTARQLQPYPPPTTGQFTPIPYPARNGH